jgi:predicted RNA-binding Zn ribbon-like protein
MTLDVLEEFVNTAHYEQGDVEELLPSPAALRKWFADHGFGAVDVRPADLRRAIEIREALRDVMGANNGQPLKPESIELLNSAAARSKVVAAFDDNANWRIEPSASGADRAFGELLTSVFRAMSDGTWSRMKACGNPDCRWAFYDGSKNRSGRWCDMASCGNRMKARAFRERQRTHKHG